MYSLIMMFEFLPWLTTTYLLYLIIADIIESIRHKKPIALLRIMRGQEPLQKVFFRYGLWQLLLVCISIGMVSWIYDLWHGYGHFREQSGDTSSQTAVAILIFSSYTFWWFLAVILNRNNIHKKQLIPFAIMIACMPMLYSVSWLAWLVKQPSIDDRAAKCEENWQHYQQVNHDWIEKEQAKQKLVHPEYYTKENMAYQKMVSIRDCIRSSGYR